MIAKYDTDEEMHEIWSEEHKYRIWLNIENVALKHWCAHLGMRAEYVDIEKRWQDELPIFGLEKIVTLREQTTHHEMTAFLDIVQEYLLKDTVGLPLHRGMTSSDVMDTALSIQMRDGVTRLRALLNNMVHVIAKLANDNVDSVCLGHTHGQRAIPMSYQRRFAAWGMQFRWLQLQAMRFEYYGKLSGPVGTNDIIPVALEGRVLNDLGLQCIQTSTQIVNRMHYAQIIGWLALVASALENVAVDIRLLSQPEIGELAEHKKPEEDGSSAMPHKANPIASEQICSLARLVRAYNGVALENIATWCERDLTTRANEKIYIPDTFILVAHMIRRMTDTLKSMHVDVSVAQDNVMTDRSVLSAMLLQFYLDQGMPRREAYDLVKATDWGAHKDVTLEEIKKHYGI